MWILILMVYSLGSNVEVTQIPDFKTSSACWNMGNKLKHEFEAGTEVTVKYRCIKKPGQ